MDRENKVSGSKYQIINDLKLDSLNWKSYTIFKFRTT